MSDVAIGLLEKINFKSLLEYTQKFQASKSILLQIFKR